MGEDELGSPGLAKTVRSFLEAMSTLEREVEIVFERASGTSSEVAFSHLRTLFGAAGRRVADGVDLVALMRKIGGLDVTGLTRMLAGALGLADEASMRELRSEVREIVEQVGRLRERELALAGGVSQLRGRTARFEEALAGLARVQGQCVARMDGEVERAQKLERLASRRDDHITRLIRDTAAQRAEIERVASGLDDLRGDNPPEQREETMRMVAEVRNKILQIEAQNGDLKRLQTGATQRVIETLESMRDRITRLESRAAEMSREARAKAGRLDALARHVATVEGRLTSAIGKRTDTMMPLTKDVERPVPVTG